MGKKLVIVESPTKIKTLKKFLGKDYVVESSVGHIRDLPKKGFGIDVENDFTPVYETLPEKKDVIAKLKKKAKECDSVILSPDPDREGEAIAWHIAEILPKGTKIQRITFNAITKDAVTEALKHPREIDHSLVDAQQARRLLDRIVGYKISPILQRRIKRGRDGGLSAGRVQSIALKLVVDREKMIEAFNPVEYWNISALLSDSKRFRAQLYSVDGLKVEKEPVKGKKVYLISDEKTAKSVASRLKKAEYEVTKIEKKEKKRNPIPPFITSTLQQEASRHYGFAAQRTMTIAQSLYEGVDMGSDGQEGLITYMRTDSVRVEPEAISGARTFIQKEFGKEYLPTKPNTYATKKGSQDAHEAIRPTNLTRPPEVVKKYLNHDQYKLYVLVWRRFVASQMVPAIYDTASCEVSTNQDIILRATGSIIKFRGFLAVYQEKFDSLDADEDKILPPLEMGEKINLIQVDSAQAFTKPPPRFTEASLVKELEKSGIGRPSTYATIMNKIHSREYTTKEKLTIVPTELGRIIAEMLETYFSIIMDLKFTVRMEDSLDEIAENHKEWKSFLKEFWDTFMPIVDKAEEEAHVPKVATDLDCPKCEKKLQKIWSKSKYFYGCENYPDCDYTAPIESLDFNKEDYAEGFDWDQSCPICKSDMTLRFGKFGPFLGCSKYPDCRGIVNIPRKGEALQSDMPRCPAKGCEGRVTMRRSRFGKPFYSCSNFPDCDVIVNDLDDLDSKYPDHSKTAYKKKPKTKSGQRGYELTKELQAVVGDKVMTRGEVTKAIWVYIKSNNLQDPDNKRLIVPDAKLEKVFGSKEPIDMMKLAGVMSKHFKK